MATNGGACSGEDAGSSNGCSPWTAPVCVDFGSNAALGLIARPERLLRVLGAAAERLQRHFILLAGAPALPLPCLYRTSGCFCWRGGKMKTFSWL